MWFLGKHETRKGKGTQLFSGNKGMNLVFQRGSQLGICRRNKDTI